MMDNRQDTGGASAPLDPDMAATLLRELSKLEEQTRCLIADAETSPLSLTVRLDFSPLLADIARLRATIERRERGSA